MTWNDWLAAVCVILASLAGVGLTLFSLPGTWLALLGSLLVWWWRPDMFSGWTFLTVFGLCVLAEAVEFFASAAGSAKAGGSGRGQLGAIVGAIAGAILGTPIFPVVGTIVGGIVGAAGGAALAERYWAKRTWQETAKSAQGAAVGKLAALILKGSFAVAIAAILIIAAFRP